MKQKLSRVKAIRITEEMEENLEEEAERKGISVSNLVNTIFNKYIEYDRFAERFGIVLITKSLFRELLNGVNDSEIDRISNYLGNINPREASILWNGTSNTESILRIMSMFSTYGKSVECEIKKLNNRRTVIFKHDFGIKWSKFISNYWLKALANTSDDAYNLEISENEVAITFLLT